MLLILTGLILFALNNYGCDIPFTASYLDLYSVNVYFVLSVRISFLICAVFFIQDLDLTKPGVRKSPKRNEFSVTTKEVLSQADFRVSTCFRVVPL